MSIAKSAWGETLMMYETAPEGCVRYIRFGLMTRLRALFNWAMWQFGNRETIFSGLEI